MTAPSVLEDHFRNPRNAGALEGADITVRADNPVCGDILHLHLRRGPDGRIEACRFQVYGCPAAIAAGSLLTELLRGAALEDLSRLGKEAIATALGGLAADKAHAAVLAQDAVRAAEARWRSP